MNNSEFQAIIAVSNAIVSVRHRDDLLRVVYEQIQGLLPFDDAGIAILNEAGDQYYEFLTEQTAPSEVNHQFLASGYFNRWLPVDTSVRKAFEAQDPLLLDVAEEARLYPDTLYFPIFEAAGIRQIMGRQLAVRGARIGTITFSSKQANQYSEATFALFNVIADQVAVAVANILANEEILEREREKSLQLAVTTALASPTAWTEKFEQVFNEIGKVIPWDIGSVIVPQYPALSMRWRKDDGGLLHYLSYEAECLELEVGPLMLRELILETQPLNVPSAVYTGEEFEQLRKQFRIINLTYQHWHIRSKIDLPIAVNGSPQVLLILSSRQPYAYTDAHLDLLLRLRPSITLALENIFSFKELEQRDAEKTRQLGLNKVLVSIRDSQHLYEAIATELNELVSFDSLSVQVVVAGRLVCYFVLGKRQGRFDDITELVRLEHPTIDRMVLEEAGAQPEQATIYTGETFTERCAQQPLYCLRRDQYGLRSTIELPLPMKEGQLAVLVLGSRAAYAFVDDDLARLSLFVPQVALAIENLLAFEEINALRKRVELEKTYLVEELKTAHNFEEIIGTSPLLTQIFKQVSQVAPTDTSVLITGESGTGKELIARAIHNRSPRKDQVLVKINCAALPTNLIESELFGHEKGSFTGATDKRVGKFELANGGSIFLDEIGEMPLELQAKLLRVLQEREYERLGSNKLHKTDVRVIAATNRNLEQEVAEGRFRLDLFYRLSVFPVHMPPLRKRLEDIPLLAHYFARKYFKKMGKPFRGIQETTMLEMMTYPWPGNIRELENVMEQAAILNDGNSAVAWGRSPNQPLMALPNFTAVLTQQPVNETEPIAQTVGAIRQASVALERERILTVLKQTGGRIRGEGGAAQRLGLKATTLEARIARLGIKRDYMIG